ncbi:hypothetical protein BD779DRAFT_1805561 [Infundibulicybe gibba]|nr:hypothetical protein BD779DRAFT_1805561 [Infundibulicybe gibba]
MAFPNATNFQIDRTTFNDAQGNINYYNRHTVQGDQNISIHGEQDIRSRVHSAMKDNIQTAAFHDSSARREISRCHPNTRKVTLKTISDWIKNPASHCLWLNGPVGAGKSAIAYTVAEQSRVDRTLGATYFFTKGSTSGPAWGAPPLFSTIAYQLMLVFPGLDEHLWAVIHADHTIFERSLSVQLEKLIVQPLLRLVNKSASAVVVVDGLDECDGDSIQGEIVRLILGLKEHSLPLLFLISSRPEPVIRRAFETFTCPSLTYLPLVRSLDSDNDIRLYLHNEFERIYQEIIKISGSRAVLQLPWPSMGDIEKLVDKSSGHFIYAATVIRFIQEDHAHPMEQLDAILKIPSESTSSPAVKSILADSTAFQELDGLYLHIMRKYRHREELLHILRAIMHFGYRAFPSHIEIIFNLSPGRICIMLAGLHAIIDIPGGDSDKPLRFSHASFDDFLNDPERSHEFYMDSNRFNAELACAYMRLIVAFSPGKSGSLLEQAMNELGGCLRATAGLLPATLRKLINVLTQGSRSTPPCLLYIILGFLSGVLQVSIRATLARLSTSLLHIQEFPEAEALYEYCKRFLQQLEPQLVELSDGIITIFRVLGAQTVARYDAYPLPVEETSWFISVPNLNEGPSIFQRILNLSPCILSAESLQRWATPIQQIYKSLYHWLLAHYQRKKWCTTHVAVSQYTWTWAWDTYALHYSPNQSRTDFVHHVDLVYGCLRLVLLDFDQPLNSIPPPIRKTLEHTPELLARACTNHKLHRPHFDLLEVIETVDFPAMSRALPDLTTTLLPRFFYLHRGLDELYYHLRAGGFYRSIPHYQDFLETVYSRLLQDLLASRAVPVIYAMFARLPSKTIEGLLCLGRSAAMQGLFGIGFWEGDETLLVSYSLGVLLKMGCVKLQPSPDNESGHIDGYMGDAHEYLAFSCMKHLLSCADPEGKDKRDEIIRYAEEYWSDHLERAKPSIQLFEVLMQVDISSHDAEPVLWGLQKSPNVPEDVLARWRAARVKHGAIPLRSPVCILDQVFASYCRKRQEDRDEDSDLEAERDSDLGTDRDSNSEESRLGTDIGSNSETDGENDQEF